MDFCGPHVPAAQLLFSTVQLVQEGSTRPGLGLLQVYGMNIVGENCTYTGDKLSSAAVAMVLYFIWSLLCGSVIPIGQLGFHATVKTCFPFSLYRQLFPELSVHLLNL